MQFLFATFALTVLWIALFFSSRETRKEQLIMSLAGLILSPGALLLALVTSPAVDTAVEITIRLDLFLFSASLFGIAAVIYQVALSKRPKPKKKKAKASSRRLEWWVLLTLLIAVWLITALLAMAIQIDPILSFILGGLFIGMFVIADRHDLLTDALVSGLLVAILLLVLEKIFVFQLFPNPTILGGIPLSEITWAAVVGFAVGPLYEYVRQWRLR